jgi:hypothetical protein
MVRPHMRNGIVKECKNYGRIVSSEESTDEKTKMAG